MSGSINVQTAQNGAELVQFTGQVLSSSDYLFCAQRNGSGIFNRVLVPYNGLIGLGAYANVLDYAACNTQNYLGSCYITAGSNALNVPGAAFVAGDVGKRFVLNLAGNTATTGGVSAVAVATSGTGYTSVPMVAFSTGAATAVASLGVLSATVLNGGSGYTASSTISVPLGGGYGSATAVLSCTTNVSGVITAVSAVTTAGAYSFLPSSISACPSAVVGSGFGATFALTLGVVAVTVTAQGSYTTAPTATLSGGSPGTAATLGAATVQYDVPPLVGTITSVTDATHVVLSVNAGTTLAGYSSFTWGTDDTAGILTAIATGKSLLFPPCGVGITSALEVYEGGPTKWIGAGSGASIIHALAAISGPMAQKTTYNAYVWTVSDLEFDAHRLATNCLLGYVGRQCRWDNVTASNAAAGGANLVIGGSGTQAEYITTNCVGQNITGYTNWSSYPNYCFWNQAPDGQHTNFLGANCAVAGVYNTGGDTVFTAPHTFGVMTYNFWDAAAGAYLSPRCDSCAPGGAGMRIDYSSGLGTPAKVIGAAVFWFPDPPVEGTRGIVLGSNAGAQIVCPDVQGIDPANMIVQSGTASTLTAIVGASGAQTAQSLGLYPSTSFFAGASFSLMSPNGMALTGATRGQLSVDLGTFYNGTTKGAAGVGSAVIGGNNQATGYAATCIGNSCIAAGPYSKVEGYQASDNGQEMSNAFGFGFSTRAGDRQRSEYGLSAITSSTTATRLYANNNGSAGFAVVGALLLSTTTLLMLIRLVGTCPATGDGVTWSCTDQQIRVGATAAATVIDTTPSWTKLAGTGAASGMSAPTLAADTTYGAPSFTVTAPNSAGWDWFVHYFAMTVG